MDGETDEKDKCNKKNKSLSTFSPSSSDTILHGGGLCDD